jgi:hypothetical protein
MTTPTPEVPGAQEPAEGSRETVDAALGDRHDQSDQSDQNESEDRISHDPDASGVSDFVPDA